VRRAERIVKLVELLHDRPGADAESLARGCGVSERTLRRDLDALAAAGLPVFFDQGYRLAAPALLPPVSLSTDEALALQLAAQRTLPQADPAAAQPLATATRKLQQALTARPAPPSPDRQLSLELPPIKDPRLEACMTALTAAIHQQRSVKLLSPGRGGTPVAVRLVDPYRLTPTATGWDLLAYCHDRRRLAWVPVAHLHEVAIQRRKFEPISDRLLARHLRREGSAAAVVRWLRLLCRPPLAQALRRHPPVGALLWEDGPDGSVVFTVGTFDPEEFLPWLLACGGTAEVLEPVALRHRLRRLAEAVAASHLPTDSAGGKGPSGPHRKPPAEDEESAASSPAVKE